MVRVDLFIANAKKSIVRSCDYLDDQSVFGKTEEDKVKNIYGYTSTSGEEYEEIDDANTDTKSDYDDVLQQPYHFCLSVQVLTS